MRCVSARWYHCSILMLCEWCTIKYIRKRASYLFIKWIVVRIEMLLRFYEYNIRMKFMGANSCLIIFFIYTTINMIKVLIYAWLRCPRAVRVLTYPLVFMCVIHFWRTFTMIDYVSYCVHWCVITVYVCSHVITICAYSCVVTLRALVYD